MGNQQSRTWYKGFESKSTMNFIERTLEARKAKLFWLKKIQASTCRIDIG